MGSFYAVHVGRKQGIFNSWNECEALVKGYKGAKYKKFTTLSAAQQFVRFGFSLKSNDEDLQSNGTPGTSNKKCKRKASSSADISCKRVKATNCGDVESPKIVYTDGACSGNGKVNCAAGYGVWWGPNHPLNLSCKLKGIQTNQRAEITAVNACIKQAKDNNVKKLLIRTDSMFVINCVNKWIPGWKTRNWVKADGKPVVHKVEFIEMLENMKYVQVEFEHIYGHTGEVGNEMADGLAVQGITKKN